MTALLEKFPLILTLAAPLPPFSNYEKTKEKTTKTNHQHLAMVHVSRRVRFGGLMRYLTRL